MIEREREVRESGCFPRLYFIPGGSPELAEVNAAVRRANGVDEGTPFAAVLRLAAGAAADENAEVRAQTMHKLKQLLWPNQARLQELIVGKRASGEQEEQEVEETSDPLVTTLVELLVRSAGDPDAEVAALAGECLGHIGAVDPGRLQPAEDLAENLVLDPEGNLFLFRHYYSIVSRLIGRLPVRERGGLRGQADLHPRRLLPQVLGFL